MSSEKKSSEMSKQNLEIIDSIERKISIHESVIKTLKKQKDDILENPLETQSLNDFEKSIFLMNGETIITDCIKNIFKLISLGKDYQKYEKILLNFVEINGRNILFTPNKFNQTPASILNEIYWYDPQIICRKQSEKYLEMMFCDDCFKNTIYKIRNKYEKKIIKESINEFIDELIILFSDMNLFQILMVKQNLDTIFTCISEIYSNISHLLDHSDKKNILQLIIKERQLKNNSDFITSILSEIYHIVNLYFYNSNGNLPCYLLTF